MHFDRERVTGERHGIILIRRTSQRLSRQCAAFLREYPIQQQGLMRNRRIPLAFLPYRR